MKLTHEQYERMINAADCHLDEYNGDESDYGPLIAAAFADIAAMRQPITAEALKAAGWLRDKTMLLLSGSAVCVKQTGSEYTVYSFCGTVNGNYLALKANNVRTMYDLGELVRLLGGSQ